MGFSTSGAAAIIFIGALLAVGIAFPALETAHDRQSTAMDDRDDRALDVRNTAIDVTVSHDGDADLTVNVTNDGSTTLSVDRTDLLVDGVLQPSDELETAVDGDANRTIVQPGETLTMTAENDAPDRLKVVTQHGVAKTLTEVDDGE